MAIQIIGQFSFRKKEDWYKISHKQLIECNKESTILLDLYGGNLINILNGVYGQQHDFHHFLHVVEAVPRNYWETLENQRKFFDCVAKKLNFSEFIFERCYQSTMLYWAIVAF